MLFSNVTIGADPELFIVDTTNANKVISSIGMIPGEKGKPYTKGMDPGYGVEIDNILGEFNIPPAHNQSEFVQSILYMQNWIRDFVKKVNPAFDIQCIASRIVDEDQLNHPIAKLFGCSIDFNVYTESPNEKPKGENTNLRSAGFHVHIGYRNPNTPQSLELVKYLDAYLGLYSVTVDPDKNRRSLYGKAGCFRLTPYGVEYRVLSSYMMSSRALIAEVYDRTIKAICACEQEWGIPDPDEVITTINTSDALRAKALIKEYEL